MEARACVREACMRRRIVGTSLRGLNRATAEIAERYSSFSFAFVVHPNYMYAIRYSSRAEIPLQFIIFRRKPFLWCLIKWKIAYKRSKIQSPAVVTGCDVDYQRRSRLAGGDASRRLHADSNSRKTLTYVRVLRDTFSQRTVNSSADCLRYCAASLKWSWKSDQM